MEGAVWPVHLRSLARAPSANELVPDALEELWSQDLGRSPSGPLALGDSVVIATTADKHVTLARRDDGRVVWRRRLKGPGAGGALFTADRVYTASADRDGQLQASELLSGKRRWRRTLGPVVGPIALLDSTIYAATAGGMLFAVEMRRGHVRWQRGFPKALQSGVTVVGSRLFVATEDSLYFVDAGSGAPITAVPAFAAVRAPPAVSGEVLVLTSPAGLIAGFDVRTLAERWSIHVRAPIFGGAAIARDTAFAATLDGELWRVPLHAPETAQPQALGRPMRTTPAPVRNGVLVGTVAGELLLIGTGSAEPRWSVTLDGPIEFPPIVDRGIVFAIDGRGRAYAWRAARSDGPGEP
jgi:outer membrane protein assembly factor BamB